MNQDDVGAGGSDSHAKINVDWKSLKQTPPSSDSNSNSAADTADADVFSTEKAVMDFITLRGIQTRTGVEEKRLPRFVFNELMDNALDYVEKSSEIRMPLVTVNVNLLQQDSILRINVGNSNHSNKGVFIESNVKKIFSYGGLYE